VAGLVVSSELQDIHAAEFFVAGELLAVLDDDDLCIGKGRLHALPKVLLDVLWKTCLPGVRLLVDEERRGDEDEVGKGPFLFDTEGKEREVERCSCNGADAFSVDPPGTAGDDDVLVVLAEGNTIKVGELPGMGLPQRPTS